MVSYHFNEIIGVISIVSNEILKTFNGTQTRYHYNLNCHLLWFTIDMGNFNVWLATTSDTASCISGFFPLLWAASVCGCSSLKDACLLLCEKTAYKKS